MCLHAAARKGHVGVVRALLSKGASVDTKTKVRLHCLFSLHDSLHLLTGIYIESFHSRGNLPCKFIATKESVSIRKELDSHRIGLVLQHG